MQDVEFVEMIFAPKQIQALPEPPEVLAPHPIVYLHIWNEQGKPFVAKSNAWSP